jgi:hypothetical protein
MANRILQLILIGVSMAVLATGQSEIGGATLNGTVTDPSGAAVANAKVTVENTSTGLTRTARTSDAGLYSFPGVPVGSYDLTVEALGFRVVKQTGISLTVGAVATVDVPLAIGSAAETVTVAVTADAPVLESTSSQTSTTVTSQAVRDLPSNGRNFLDFTVLTPGVVRDPTRGGDLSFGGQRGTANSVLVDGSDSNNVFFGQSTERSGTGRNPYSFSQDSVQEFQVSH